MPYIKKENRQKFDNLVDKLSIKVTCEGDLNYIITCLLHIEVMKNGKTYQTLNNLVGMLECAKLELYRKIIGPYEDIKCEENGDVL